MGRRALLPGSCLAPHPAPRCRFEGARDELYQIVLGLHDEDGGTEAEGLPHRALDLVAPNGLLPSVYSRLRIPQRSCPALLNLPAMFMVR